MAAEWFYQVMGQQFGPVSSAELRALAAAGTVQPDTLVRKGTDGEWVFASRVHGLFEPSGSPPTVADRPAAKNSTPPGPSPPLSPRVPPVSSPVPVASAESPTHTPPFQQVRPWIRYGVPIAVLVASIGILVAARWSSRSAFGAFGLFHWLIVALVIGLFGYVLYRLGKTLRAGRCAPGEEQVRPWIRYWARFLDTYVAALVIGFVVGIVYPPAAEWNEFLFGMALFFAYCFIEPIFGSSD